MNIFKKIGGKIKCKIGFHDFDWNYVINSTCNQIGKCKRGGCEKISERVFHVWNIWRYLSNYSCLQEKVCARCNMNEKRINHTWSNWEYLHNNSCLQEKVCLRCNISEEQTNHLWGPWQYESETSCHQIAFCQRCYKRRDHRESYSHRWTETKDPETGRWRRTCSHCGESHEKIK